MPSLPNPDQLADFLKIVFEAVMAGKWTSVAAFALVLAIWGARKYLVPHVPFLATQAGGALLALGTAVLGGCASALLAGAGVSWPVILAAVTLAVKAAGGWTLASHLLPLLYPLLAKMGMPGLLDAHAVKLEAKAAGVEAVKALKVRTVEDVVNGAK